jgi:hypothetical protein
VRSIAITSDDRGEISEISKNQRNPGLGFNGDNK